MGLGGSMRYKPGEHQYTEWEMRRRVFKLFPKLVWRRGFDILVTHAPAYQLNDARDLPHQGFKNIILNFFCMVMFICRMEDNTNDTINIWIHM